ncbi:MAG: hypothetical protein AB1505_05985 [Candidatus Latescibacterota bacterium]
MSTLAVLMMVLTMGTVTAFTVYFFVKVLRTPPHPAQEPEREIGPG